MLKAKDALHTTARRTILIQVLLTVAAASIAWAQQGGAFALALAYGGGVVVIGTGIQAWRLRVATESTEGHSQLDTAELFKGIVVKLIVMVGLLVLGVGPLALVPLAVVIGLGVAYTGFLFSRGYAPRSGG
jgi:F0F1-type ATP synthase assembly protein I